MPCRCQSHSQQPCTRVHAELWWLSAQTRASWTNTRNLQKPIARPTRQFLTLTLGVIATPHSPGYGKSRKRMGIQMRWKRVCWNCVVHASCLRLTVLTVYRVNFLRAKARRDRWVEEKKILESEIGCTHRYFVHKQKEWLKRVSGEPGKHGHNCYAHKQASNWDQLAQSAAAAVAAASHLVSSSS